jgi:hypothetical protein
VQHDTGLIALDSCSEVSIAKRDSLFNVRKAEHEIILQSIGGLAYLEEEGELQISSTESITLFVSELLPPNCFALLGVEEIKGLSISLDLVLRGTNITLQQARLENAVVSAAEDAPNNLAVERAGICAYNSPWQSAIDSYNATPQVSLGGRTPSELVYDLGGAAEDAPNNLAVESAGICVHNSPRTRASNLRARFMLFMSIFVPATANLEGEKDEKEQSVFFIETDQQKTMEMALVVVFFDFSRFWFCLLFIGEIVSQSKTIYPFEI